MNRPRLAILFDYAEENWPSMELTARMLSTGLQRDHSARFMVESVRAPYRRRFERLSPRGRNADRLINRFVDYPRHVRRIRNQFDLFHVSDHSYAQLLHQLPAQQTGVYCHDLDTFRCLLDPESEPRPWWFRKMAQRILGGLQKAAIVFYSTHSVREQILRHNLIEAGRLIQAPPGVSDLFFQTPDEKSSHVADGNIALDHPYLLHVGSSIPRKRVDVLLKIFAGIRPYDRDLRLIQIGATWTNEQKQLIGDLGIGDALIHATRLPASELAVLYRFARVVMQPSSAEGFGLPVIESLASGTCVLASDIPVLREVGGSAATYAPAGDVDAWTSALRELLQRTDSPDVVEQRRSQARRYTWANHCRIIADAYGRLIS